MKSITERFRERNCQTLQHAISFVHTLPYGRNRNRSDYQLVLTEKKGTCSTKHALIAAFAEEQEIPLSLCMGLFEMNAQNTPQIAKTLEKYNLDNILEAHCYLFYENKRVDITFPDKIAYPEQSNFVEEFFIAPNQIGEYKLALHKKYMEQWIQKNNISYDLEQLWKIREECIAVLSLNIK